MTDKEYETEKKRIRKYIDQWARPIGLGYWKIDFVFERVNYQKSITDGKRMIDESVHAECDVRPNYLEATITFYLRNTIKVDKDELEETVVHELMHIFLSPMSTKDTMDPEEIVATTLSRGFIKIRNEKPKKVGKKGK